MEASYYYMKILFKNTFVHASNKPLAQVMKP